MSWKITSVFSIFLDNFSYSVLTDQQSQEQDTNKVYHTLLLLLN